MGTGKVARHFEAHGCGCRRAHGSNAQRDRHVLHGYEGKNRYYALEEVLNLDGDSWYGVARFTNILGTNTSILYAIPGTNSPAFYRGRVWLAP